MNFSEAVDWVRENEATITNLIARFCKFSPYEEHDFMQDAFESALIAVLRSETKKITFEAAFWQIFRNRITAVTPNPDSRHGSNSVPTHLCTVDFDLTSIPQSESRPGPDIEAIFNAICRHMTKREQRVFSLALGITDEGAFTNYEIAKLLECTVVNVRDAQVKAIKRIKCLVGKGRINPKRFR